MSLHLAVFLLPIFLLSDCFDTTLQLNINTLIALTFILKGKKLRTNIIRFDPDTFSSVGPEFGFHYGRIRNSKHVCIPRRFSYSYETNVNDEHSIIRTITALLPAINYNRKMFSK